MPDEEKKYTKTQLESLVSDDEFQKWIAEDQELTRLWDAPKRSIQDNFSEIGLALGGHVAIGDALIRSPSIGSLMVLAALESPFVVSTRKDNRYRLLDVDVAVYVLANGKEAMIGAATPVEIEAKASGLCASLEIDYVEAAKVIDEMLIESFQAMNRINSTGSGKCRFDLAWYAITASKAARMAGVSADAAAWEMPLSLAMYYVFVSYLESGGKGDLSPRDGGAIMERVNEMMDYQIAKKGYK